MKYNDRNLKNFAADAKRLPPLTAFDFYDDTVIIVTNDRYAKKFLTNFFSKNKKMSDFSVDFPASHVLH